MQTSNKLSLLAHFARARRRWKHLRGTALERFQEQHALQPLGGPSTTRVVHIANCR